MSPLGLVTSSRTGHTMGVSSHLGDRWSSVATHLPQALGWSPRPPPLPFAPYSQGGEEGVRRCGPSGASGRGCPLFLAGCRDEPPSGAEPDSNGRSPVQAPQGPCQAPPPEVAPVKRDQEAFLPIDGLVPLHPEGAAAVPLVARETVNGDLPVSALRILPGFEKLTRQRKDPA